MKYMLLTVSGRALLEQYRYKQEIAGGDASDVRLLLCDDLLLSADLYPQSALLTQLKQQVMATGAPEDTRDLFSELLVFVDFSAAFPLADRTTFDALLENGVFLGFGETYARFVPFERSQSQAKNHILSFIREDLLAPMRSRLDLDIAFEDMATVGKSAYLAKLYAYRALYMSDAEEVFSAAEAGLEYFFSECNIVVLPEKEHRVKEPVAVCTAEQTGEVSVRQEIKLKPIVTQASVGVTCFDGEGLISPAYARLINDRIPAEKAGHSFQVRMPFFKGVLHTVDFHAFLREAGLTERAIVIDAFGRERDLFKANIIVTPSMFKLCSLKLEKRIGKDVDPMNYYFDKIKAYRHGLYLVRTEKSFRKTGYTKLTSQFLSTLDLPVEIFDELVREHKQWADAFMPENLAYPERIRELVGDGDVEGWMELLLADDRFIHDPHIRSMLKNYRVSQYNEIGLGRIRIKGENRFLSGDLFYFLLCLLENLSSDGPETARIKEWGKTVSRQRLKHSRVYIPGVSGVSKVALFRSPHLSRNEDVGAYVATENDYYKTYLSHLTGVIFVGDRSRIPAALGGADFDGDHVNIVYDDRIVDTCFRSGYVEGKKASLPFIHIKPLSSLNNKDVVRPYRYVSSDVIYNTFSSRIGQISNAAMQLAAVEYDRRVDFPEDYSAAFCTILTGNEIDAGKKGVRPYIDEVVAVAARRHADKTVKDILKETALYIAAKEELRSWGGRIPRVARDGEEIVLSESFGTVKLKPNRDRANVTQLLYRWAEAFLNFEVGGSVKAEPEVLQKVFRTRNPAEAETDAVLEAYETVRREYAANRRKQQRVAHACRLNESKIKVILKGQYDDLYAPVGGRSYNDRYALLQQRVNDAFSHEELAALKEMLYSEKSERFNAETFWPYTTDERREALDAVPAVRRLNELEDTDLVRNFDYGGYRLLYYILDNAANAALSEPAEDDAAEASVEAADRVLATYRKLGKACAEKNLAVGAFERVLADVCIQDLRKALGLEADGQNRYIATLIRTVYPTKPKYGQTFWRIFSVRQVIHALDGDKHAE